MRADQGAYQSLCQVSEFARPLAVRCPSDAMRARSIHTRRCRSQARERQENGKQVAPQACSKSPLSGPRAIVCRNMEITCSRCHQPVIGDSCYCPTCGLPQLVYSSDENTGPQPQEKWSGAVNEASAVEWRPALRSALVMAIPAGLLSCGVSPVGTLGLFWMSAAAAWAVMLYVRGQRPGWITMGSGARIGFVTGLISAWVAFAATGVSLFAMRDVLGRGRSIDQVWQTVVAEVSRQWQSMNPDPQTSAILKGWLAWLQSPEARAGWILFGMGMLAAAMLAFATLGGALGARLLARGRRRQV